MSDLDDALAAYSSGELDRAVTLVDRVLDDAPRHADALMLAGLIAHRRGDRQASVTLFDRAVEADPEHGPAWTNRAHPLAALGRLDEAETSLRRALALGATPQAAALLVRVLLAAGRPATALEDGEALRQELPDHALLALLTGQAALLAGRPDRALLPLSLALRAGRPEAGPFVVRALRDQGRPADALALLDRLPHPADAELHNLRGTVQQALGDAAAAEAAFRAALVVDPDHGAAHHNLATARFRAGDPDGALPHHLAALRADPDDAHRWIGFVDTVARLTDLPDAAVPLVARALRRPDLAVQGLERAARLTVSRRPAVVAALDGAPLDETVIEALDDPLTHAWWRRTRVLGPTWERLLTRLRRAHLLDGALEGHPVLAVALAVQAWHTEHAWWVEPDEQARLDALAAEEHPVRHALYAPIPRDAIPRRLPDVLRHLHITFPAEERALAAALPSLGQTADPTSAAVRAQYEEHPYPRLLSVHRKPPLSLPALMRATLPHVEDVPDPRPLRVLIAGCGTGQQVLGASRYAHAEILAVDLSLASLGVAARQVRAWGLEDRVELAQADLLALGGLDRTFDVIECGGVLHHLADPLAGWRVLTDLLAPAGLMKIALYSERARTGVVAARALVDDLPLDADGLRASRRRLLELPEGHPARSVVWSPDFPSLSGFRDLVRHACEHRFTPRSLQTALDTLGLEFLGFQHPDPRPAAWYAERFPDDPEQRDLARWDLVEEEHPESFVGMFQLWCRRA